MNKVERKVWIKLEHHFKILFFLLFEEYIHEILSFLCPLALGLLILGAAASQSTTDLVILCGGSHKRLCN